MEIKLRELLGAALVDDDDDDELPLVVSRTSSQRDGTSVAACSIGSWCCPPPAMAVVVQSWLVTSNVVSTYTEPSHEAFLLIAIERLDGGDGGDDLKAAVAPVIDNSLSYFLGKPMKKILENFKINKREVTQL